MQFFIYLSRLFQLCENKSGEELLPWGLTEWKPPLAGLIAPRLLQQKLDLASLTRTIAIGGSRNGITANMVCPGDIIDEWKEKNIEETQ